MFVHGWVIVDIGVWDDLRFCLVYRCILVGLVWFGGRVGWIFIVLDAGHFLTFVE